MLLVHFRDYFHKKLNKVRKMRMRGIFLRCDVNDTARVGMPVEVVHTREGFAEL